jgi:hypothetical protein
LSGSTIAAQALTATTIGATGVVTANAGVVVDNITIDGTEIDLSSGDLTLDVAGNIILDADSTDIILKDGGTTYGQFFKDGNNFKIVASIQDGDIVFRGNDGGSGIDAMTIDMSDAGAATFNNGITLSDGDLTVASGHGINFAATSDASGMTSELLDDYEEGTWTPTLPQGGTVNTVIDAHYIKIGSLVEYYMYAGFTPTNNSSYFRIGGIPYTPIQNNHGGGSIQYAQALNVQHWSGPLAHHDGYLYFHRLDGNTAVIANSEFGGSQYNLILHGVYTIL